MVKINVTKSGESCNSLSAEPGPLTLAVVIGSFNGIGQGSAEKEGRREAEVLQPLWTLMLRNCF